jgi:hypothetical protein
MFRASPPGPSGCRPAFGGASTIVPSGLVLALASACGGEPAPGSIPAPDGGAVSLPANGAASGAAPAAPSSCPPGQSIVNGACAATGGAPPPAAPGCSFDTHTVFMFQNRVIESLTSHGRLFNFEADGSPWPTNGMDLTQVAYFAAGPCSGQGAGQCKFDTRTFALFPGNHLIEFVTAGGRSYAWENGSATDPGTDLATSPRFSEICALRPAGTPCSFDTRTFVNVNGQLTETITAYGRYFAFDRLGNKARESGTDLSSVPRYATGPCQGRASGQCMFDTRTYGIVDSKLVEIVTAGGTVWRYLAEPQTGFTEVQPSNVPVFNVPTWTAACR